MKYTNIVIGIIIKKNKIYITKARKKKYVLDLWEFPGGKVKENENLTYSLKRELSEEVGLKILRFRFFRCIKYFYKKIKLYFFLITRWKGRIYSKEGYLYKWIFLDDLKYFNFPSPNSHIIHDLEKMIFFK
ncbi:NUDIX domain-containing protein [Buchnera aphidicola]|jgi:8-oxo-dGTP diphosphatase|uniref:NUDIX domain-containing protein n=1 Tax=Buchnera aphidicola TaxID=9 RepID=UPI000D59E27B|nr:NUDIX domain-containing protein [Buchnera aphidicola]AWI49742.1 DNA mismatch repair protein MutT [Buchnera aphidicola (Schizaphis graminum)]